MMQIKILVATHKQFRMPENIVYLPIRVGSALHGEEDFGYQRDDEGENISEKNPYYSEMTAVYWAWKNLKADYIGLVHYRRHFCFRRKGKKWDSILTTQEAEQLCGKYDLILPKKRMLYIETVYSHYNHTIDGKQFDIARSIIAEQCNEYLPYFDKAMKRRHEHLFNMFIMRKDLFESYCSWIFPILNKFETFYDLKSMDSFQARLVGRISERLMDVWVMKNELKYKEIGYLFLGKSNLHKKVISFLMAKFFGKKYKQSF